jgi:hypothetical protein
MFFRGCSVNVDKATRPKWPFIVAGGAMTEIYQGYAVTIASLTPNATALCICFATTAEDLDPTVTMLERTRCSVS